MNDQKNQSNLTGYTILVMDDDDAIRELFELNLTRLGCEVILASNGSEALARYNESLTKGKQIDALIMDLSIPGGMGGKELSVKLREINSNIKLIISSGDSSAPEMLEYKKHGFDGALEKNFNREVMKSVLERVLLSK